MSGHVPKSTTYYDLMRLSGHVLKSTTYYDLMRWAMALYGVEPLSQRGWLPKEIDDLFNDLSELIRKEP